MWCRQSKQISGESGTGIHHVDERGQGGGGTYVPCHNPCGTTGAGTGIRRKSSAMVDPFSPQKAGPVLIPGRLRNRLR